jgi:3-oxoacyl-[acyl-carrier-protein] synthase-1
MDRTEFFYEQFLKDQRAGDLHDVHHHTCGNTTELIADDLGITNFVSTINTACSSSVNSIIFGSRLIRHGVLDIVIAGGTDALTRFTLNGFNSLMILDSQPCRPFDETRAGLNLGEGAGYLVLVSKKVLRAEGLQEHCQISGFANTNDAFHQTASSPEGRGSFSAMQRALEMSGLNVEAIDYINLHGTGTINNDQSEGHAIQRLFGQVPPALSSTKSFTGHTLGACGGIEAAYSVMSIREGCLFPNLRFGQPMKNIGLTPQTTFERNVDVTNVMSNSFGFGGNCSSIIFSRN